MGWSGMGFDMHLCRYQSASVIENRLVYAHFFLRKSHITFKEDFTYAHL